MSTTIVHLVRHGEVRNPEAILYGRLPGYHLSSRGESQAARTAASFHGHDVAYVACSPLERAQETAAPVAAITGCERVIDEGLLEAGNRFEGLHIKGVRSQLWNPVRWPLLRRPGQPSWGEPYEAILERMLDAVERARLAAEGHEAVLVSHQLPVVMVQRWVAGKKLAHNPAARRCTLASVTSLIFHNGKLTDHSYAEPAREI